MTLVAVPATPGRWLDTDVPLTRAVCVAIKAAGYVGVIRYLPLPGNSAAADISADELQNICAAGLQCLLVQHVRKAAPSHTGWLPAAHSGADDAAAAASHATMVGYPGKCHIFGDTEDVNGTSAETETYWINWGAAMPFRRGLYHGFAPGLSMQELYDLPMFDAYWRAPGQQVVDYRGDCIVQGRSITIGGIEFDEDMLAPDKLGGVPMACAAAPELVS